MSSGSLFDLKAELALKKAEVSGVNQRSFVKKGSLCLKKCPDEKAKSGNNKRELKNSLFMKKQEEELELKRCRATLEAKAKFYEKMSSKKSGMAEDGSKFYLVDFQKKVLDDKLAKIQTDPARDEMVSIVDGFGRRRLCTKEDAKKIKEMDEELSSSSSSEEEVLEKPNFGPIHYQQLREDEIRELGVSYYDFSVDEEERNMQMQKLLELHEKTKELRRKRKLEKKQKKNAMSERLAKIRKMHGLPAKSPDEPSQSDTTEQKSDEDESDQEFEEMQKVLEARLRNHKKAIESNRAWDRSKVGSIGYNSKKSMTDIYEERIKQARAERLDEFAPPTDLYESANSSFKLPRRSDEEVSETISQFISQQRKVINNL